MEFYVLFHSCLIFVFFGLLFKKKIQSLLVVGWFEHDNLWWVVEYHWLLWTCSSLFLLHFFLVFSLQEHSNANKPWVSDILYTCSWLLWMVSWLWVLVLMNLVCILWSSLWDWPLVRIPNVMLNSIHHHLFFVSISPSCENEWLEERAT